jgi:dethiobiotin synthetase
MQIFITGTGTNIGKTLVCSWLCLHTGYAYFKPIQTGTTEGTDSNLVSKLAGTRIYKEAYRYKAPLSPHLAASLVNEEIDITKIMLPATKNLIVEGAGGLLVPVNKKYFIIDLIKQFSIPVILVANTNLGTINHTLLSLEALKARDIKILGVICSGTLNQDNIDAIEFYGNTKVLACLPFQDCINKDRLRRIPLTASLQQLFGTQKNDNACASR